MNPEAEHMYLCRLFRKRARTATAQAVPPVVVEDLARGSIGRLSIENFDQAPDVGFPGARLKVSITIRQCKRRCLGADACKSTEHHQLAEMAKLIAWLMIHDHDQAAI